MEIPLRLLLVRHGATDANREGLFLGRMDPSLSEEGRQQARMLAERLQGEQIAHIVSSPLQRAYQTAIRIAEPHNLSVTVDKRLVELDYGRWDGLGWEEVGAMDPDGRAAWLRDGVHDAPHGGETMSALAARVRAVLDDLGNERRSSRGALVLVLHGAALAAGLCVLLETPLRGRWPYLTDTGSLSEVWWYEESAVLVRLNC